MKIKIVIDANIIISALLGGKARFILFDTRFEFIAADFVIKEAQKYIPLITKKSGVKENEIQEALSLLPLRIVGRSFYQVFLVQARALMSAIDKNDIDILALYLKEGNFLWTEDKHFEKVTPKLNLLKTEDLI